MSTPAEMFLKHDANVIAERSTQYGDAARLDLAPLPPHGCRATVTLPLPPTTTP